MKFTDGFWRLRHGVTASYAAEAYDVIANDADGDARLVVTAPTRPINSRGDTLNRPALTVTLSSPLEGVIGVRIDHHRGAVAGRTFDLVGAQSGQAVLGDRSMASGDLTATVGSGAPWSLAFDWQGQRLTSSGAKSLGLIQLAPDAAVERGPVPADTYLHEQLALGVGELIYGLGERFGPMVKNGQTIDSWNGDGGTSSELAYKNVPLYLSSRGYGVLVNHPGHVSFEVGSETVERVQFSVSGESLEYFVIAGPTPREILDRYTRLTGRPARVPAWSYGLWLSTSFTTDYDEATVAGFIDEMAARELPLSVFHFDCFWMREFNWCDFEWDSRVFPDPEGMLTRLHDKDVRVSVWINPYIAERSPLFAEGAAAGYLLRRTNGSVYQRDQWQSGMGIVDFTNPDAVLWYQAKLRVLLEQGVDVFKTDFGEQIPTTDVVWFDGEDPERMHNLYAQLYNRAVFEVLDEHHGAGEAVVFARTATVGGQALPVHWGGDSTSSFESMAETLRGGLSLAMSGFSFWSHDIGGFDGSPDPAVYKRWTAFGLLSSHSRFHGLSSYRVPWLVDDEAVDVTRVFTHLKLTLMPYLYAVGLTATASGSPVMRPMQFEFPDDPACQYLDRQYMLGGELLVAPVFTDDGVVQFYLPRGTWTNFFTGERVDGGVWRTETHGMMTIPLYVREGAIIPMGARHDRPDYDYLDGLVLDVYPGEVGRSVVTVTTPTGAAAEFAVERTDSVVSIRSEAVAWSARLVGGEPVAASHGEVELPL